VLKLGQQQGHVDWNICSNNICPTNNCSDKNCSNNNCSSNNCSNNNCSNNTCSKNCSNNNCSNNNCSNNNYSNNNCSNNNCSNSNCSNNCSNNIYSNNICYNNIWSNTICYKRFFFFFRPTISIEALLKIRVVKVYDNELRFGYSFWNRKWRSYPLPVLPGRSWRSRSCWSSTPGRKTSSRRSHNSPARKVIKTFFLVTKIS